MSQQQSSSSRPEQSRPLRRNFVPGGDFLSGDEDLDIDPPRDLDKWTVQFERAHRQKLIRKYNAIIHHSNDEIPLNKDESGDIYGLGGNFETLGYASAHADGEPDLESGLVATEEKPLDDTEDNEFWMSAADLSLQSDQPRNPSVNLLEPSEIEYDAAFKAMILAHTAAIRLWLKNLYMTITTGIRSITGKITKAVTAFFGRTFDFVGQALENDESVGLCLVPVMLVLVPIALLAWLVTSITKAIREAHRSVGWYWG